VRHDRTERSYSQNETDTNVQRQTLQRPLVTVKR
jgi:hypothetical protein